MSTYNAASVNGDISIREAVREDIPQMLEIYNEVILNTTAVYNYDPHTLEMRTEWFETKQQQHLSHMNFLVFSVIKLSS